MRFFNILILLISISITNVKGQTDPYTMVERMGRGINLGNTFSAPEEGNWAPVVYEQYFIDVKNAGFTNVRIPMDFYGNRTEGSTSNYSSEEGTSSQYMGDTSDYVVNELYLNRIEEVVNWSLNQDLVTIIDFHGTQLKSEFIYTFSNSNSQTDPTSAKRAADLDKFKSIWTQISNRFKGYSENLLFEIINEPYFHMSKLEMDTLNTDILAIIRASGGSNATRNVIITGGGQNSQNAPQQISDAVIESDNYLIASFHYYQPFSFTSSSTVNNNDFNWGTNADKNSVDAHFDAVKNWSNSKNIPVTLGEFGADNENGLNYKTGIYGLNGGPINTSRVEYHRYIAEQAINRGFSFSAWDAGNKSNKAIHLRTDNLDTTNSISGIWVEDIKNALLFSTIWSGNTDNDWDTASNWSDGIPVSTSDILIPNSLTYYPTASSAVTVNSVKMASGSSLKAQSTFSGSISYNRNLLTNNWYLVSSPVAGETYDDYYVAANGIALGTGNNRGIALYTANDDSWDYMQAGETTSFSNGTGYSVKRTSTGDVSFTGSMNTNDAGVDVVLSSAGNRFNLLGNPYTSHIASATFLNQAAISETQTLWVWNQASGASGAYEVKTIADAMVIAPAQGFFVKANAAGGTFNFAESNQASSGGTFQRTEIRPEIYLTISDQTEVREAKIYYIENMTTGFDVGYEGELFNGVSNPLAIYTHLVADSEGKNYQVQSLPINNYENMIIPVGINAVSGTVVTIDASTNNFPEGINIYLEDKQDNSFTLLDDDSNFSTSLEDDLSGIGSFYLHTTTGTLSTDALEIHNNISIYKTSNDNLRVTGVQNGSASIQIYNILGKQMMRTSFEGMGVNDISLPTLPNGVYIIKLGTQTGTTNKKIIF